MSNTNNVQAFLLGINLDVEWKIGLKECICLFAELTNCSVGCTSLVHMWLMFIPNDLLKFENKNLKQAEFVEKLSSPDIQSTFSLQLLQELWCSRLFIAIIDLAILQSNSVNHGVTIKAVMAVVLGEELRVWAVSEVDSIDVGWNSTGNDVYHLVGVFMVNWSKVTPEEWVSSWFNVKLII
jgi:hypothetical protein